VYTEITTPLPYNDGTWHHAAAVLRNGLAELYVDGTIAAQDTTNPLSSVRPSTRPTVGQVASDFVGDIDEVRVFSRALTSGEIAAMVPPARTDGLVLSYDMQSLTAGGWMRDLSGQGRNGALTGTTDVSGKAGRARHFAGGERISASAIPTTGLNFTVAAWFNWTTNPSPYYSGIRGGGASWELRVQNDGRFAVVFYQAISPDVFTAVASPLPYNDGAWHHAAGVIRLGLAELYVDGVIVGRATTSPISSVRRSTVTEIGHVASYFVGDIDEVRVYNRSLSAAEILDLELGIAYAANLPQASVGAELPSLTIGDPAHTSIGPSLGSTMLLDTSTALPIDAPRTPLNTNSKSWTCSRPVWFTRNEWTADQ